MSERICQRCGCLKPWPDFPPNALYSDPRVRRRIDVCLACEPMPTPPRFNEWLDALSVDWGRYDPAYWRDVFRSLQERRAEFYFEPETFPPGERTPVAHVLARRTRRRKLDANDAHEAVYGPGPDGWTSRYGEDTARQLEEALSQATSDCHCVDNERAAPLDSRADMRRYRKARAAGCCGSEDFQTDIGGRRFVLGFNYGH